MILVLSGNGSEARTFSAILNQENLEHLCVLPTLKEAAAYGSGNLVVGKFDNQKLEELFQEEKITGVADVDAGGNDMSRVAMATCRKWNLPYVKYLPLPETGRDLVTGMAGSYREIAEGVNCLSGAAVLYTAPAAAAAIAGMVEDSGKLYAPIPREGRFDVAKALAYGLPLRNVVEMDYVEGEEAIQAFIQKVDAKLLICDGTYGVIDQIAVADRENIPVIMTHKTGMDYTLTAWSADALVRVLRGWKKD